MATQESLARVQALYVAYYGRPADQEGQEYWADRLDAEGEGAIINAFGNSEEYAALAEGQGNATLINAIYQQAFGRGADPEGLAYYAGVLERGEKTLAEIATTIINAAGGQDRQVLNARVEAAAEYTAEFGAADDYNLEAAKSVVSETDGGIYLPQLTAALQALTDAQEAKTEYLESVADNELVVEELTDGDTNADAADPDNVTVVEVEAAIGQAQTEIATALSNARAANSDRVLEANLQDAQDEVASYEAEIAKVAGLKRAVETKQATAAALEEATTARDTANANLAGATITFDQLNGTNVDLSTGVEYYEADGTTLVDPATGNVNDIAIITDVNGVELFTAKDGVLSASTDSATVALELKGLDALQASVQAKLDAEVAVDEAVEDDGEADDTLAGITDLSDADFQNSESTGTDVYNQLDALETTVTTEQDALDDRQELIADSEEINGLADELEALNDSIDDANTAITDADDGLGVDVLSGAVDFDLGDDVYLFQKDQADVTFINFAADGQDSIFFGTEFSLVELSEEDGDDFLAADFTSNVGEEGALEIFWVQNSNDLQLFVETKAFAGNGSTDADFVEITLAGINATEIDFTGGYLTSGEPA